VTQYATLDVESEIFAGGARAILAYDEVGRGALAGPVVVGVALLRTPMGEAPQGLADSKELSEAKRTELVGPIKAWCDVATGYASAAEIDEFGILAALRAAAERATRELLTRTKIDPKTTVALVDGNYDWLTRPERIDAGEEPVSVAKVMVRKKADRDCASVAAASVVAKVERDLLMATLGEKYPEYGWAGNKGYGTAAHRAAISTMGACELHRRSWNLV